MWPFKRKKTNSVAGKREIQRCFTVGQFELDAHVPADVQVNPLTTPELSMLGAQISFVNEVIVWAPTTKFDDLDWKIVLGLVNGVVYKISMQFTGLRSEVGHFNRFFAIRCNRDFSNGPTVGDAQIWDAINGNICTDSHNIGNEGIVTVTLTSSAIKNFKRIS
jgi:hypothetical protein